jgi:hypothetical protein
VEEVEMVALEAALRPLSQKKMLSVNTEEPLPLYAHLIFHASVPGMIFALFAVDSSPYSAGAALRIIAPVKRRQ